MGILTNVWVETALLTLGMVLFLAELLKNTKGILAMLSAVSFGLFFYGVYLSGSGSMMSFIVFVIGLLLIILEVFIPGFGLPGILGAIAFIAGIKGLSANWYNAMIYIVVSGTATILALIWMLKDGVDSSRFGSLVLKKDLSDGASKDKAQVGDNGITITPLRPAGKASFDGNIIDVVTQGDYIGANESVVVYKTDGIRIVVRKK